MVLGPTSVPQPINIRTISGQWTGRTGRPRDNVDRPTGVGARRSASQRPPRPCHVRVPRPVPGRRLPVHQSLVRQSPGRTSASRSEGAVSRCGPTSEASRSPGNLSQWNRSASRLFTRVVAVMSPSSRAVGRLSLTRRAASLNSTRCPRRPLPWLPLPSPRQPRPTLSAWGGVPR